MSTPNLPYLDAEEGMKRIGNNKALFSRLLDTFLKDKSWDTIVSSLDAGDLPAAANAAHAIKGMCANLSMKALSAKAAELELLLKSGETSTALLEEVAQVRQGTLDTIAAFKATL